MKYLVILALVAFMAAGFKDGEKEYYPSGKVKWESHYDSTCTCDHFTSYYENGQKQKTANYKHNGPLSFIDGPVVDYFENGTIAVYCVYSNKMLQGRKYANFKDGTLGYECFYSDGYKVGTWAYYNEDKSLRLAQHFEPNKTKWDSDNDFVKNDYYLKGKLAYTAFLTDGKQTELKVYDQKLYDQLTAQQSPDGQKLFISNCAACHNMKMDIVGPMLKDVVKKREGKWLRQMIVNGNKLVENNDGEAIVLYSKWGNMQHPNFEKLDAKEVDMIIEYLGK